MPQGHFIQIDGLDGAGKSTLLLAARAWAEARGLVIFDVVDWCKREKRLPTFEDVQHADVLLTAEPTHAGIGDMIRNEIMREGAPYDAHFTAHAYALDRGVQFRRLLFPFLQAKPNGWIIQDRGVICSLAYQPLQSERDTRRVTVAELLELHGNMIAMERVPDIFVLLDIDHRVAQERLAQRTDKQDNDRFSGAGFQEALATRFQLDEVTQPYTKRGTKIRVLDGSQTKEAVAADMTRILEEASLRA